MDYQTFEPHKDLSDFVKCYWTLEGPKEAMPHRQRIVPDGCMEMIFHYGDLYRQYLDDDYSIIQPRCFVFGQLTRPLEIEPTGETGIFSVRFQPGGFMPFAAISLKEMDNKAIALEQLFGKDGLEIESKILNAGTASERIRLIEAFLMQRLEDTTMTDRIVKSTIHTIITANGQLPVNKLSEQMNINRRQLERKFSSNVGLSPKQLSKVVRLQAALKMLLNRQFTSLTTLAYEGEYYDQAHFIKDFKEFTGRTPKEFYGENLKMSLFFSGSD